MEFKATEIAAFLNGEIVGDEKVSVNNISKIEEGKRNTLSFLANEKYENYIYSTESSIVLVNKSFEPKSEISATLIKVDDAYKAFASLLKLYHESKLQSKSGIEQPSFIHETAHLKENIYVGAFAYIGKNVTLGDNVKIYPNVYIDDNVTIGDNTTVYAGVKIYSDVEIGKNCTLHAGAVIGSDGFGFAQQEDYSYEKIPQIGNVIIEDNVDIGANTTIDCATMGSTIIRKGAKIDNLVQIGHNCEIGENSAVAGQAGFAGTTKIGKNCKVAGQAGFSGHLNIADNVQVGAQAGINRSAKEGEILFSSPAFNLKDAMKSAVVYRKLPQMYSDLSRLRVELNELKKKE